MVGLIRPRSSKRPRSSNRKEALNLTDHNMVDPLGDSAAACDMDEVERGFDAVVKSKNLLKDDLLSLKNSGGKKPVPYFQMKNALMADIESPWNKTIIINLLGKSFGFYFLSAKLHQLWKPNVRIRSLLESRTLDDSRLLLDSDGLDTREWMMVQKIHNASVCGKKDGRKSTRGEGSNRFAGLADEMEEAKSVERTHEVQVAHAEYKRNSGHNRGKKGLKQGNKRLCMKLLKAKTKV
ncbi:hypothetical protein K2173_013707 [Erythroxylum novogranatense]|uniref:Uncharacterized protein n=1 Tax=Erythroxylum novogranatense TaxID=1862640 RepID=A0AAV8SAS7_9ROSI|nr:hypothetical protein K2173_013707 [Erythroxylum novogranatense]